jgi:hypothetical protein
MLDCPFTGRLAASAGFLVAATQTAAGRVSEESLPLSWDPTRTQLPAPIGEHDPDALQGAERIVVQAFSRDDHQNANRLSTDEFHRILAVSRAPVVLGNSAVVGTLSYASATIGRESGTGRNLSYKFRRCGGSLRRPVGATGCGTESASVTADSRRLGEKAADCFSW